MLDAAPTTALPVPDGSADEAWRETSMLYFRAAVERLYWQDIAVMHLRVTNCGNIPPRCIPGRSPMAKCSRNAFPRRPAVARYRRGAFPGGDPWRLFHFMRSRRGLGREKRQFVATYRRRASEKRRKQPSENTPREDLARKGPFSLRGPLRSCTARRSCRRSALAGRWALCVEGRGAGLRKRTPYCCRRSRVPARHLVALCGGSLSRSRAPRPAARCARPALQPTPRLLSVGSGFP